MNVGNVKHLLFFVILLNIMKVISCKKKVMPMPQIFFKLKDHTRKSRRKQARGELTNTHFVYIVSYSSGVSICPDKTSQEFMDTSDLRAIRFNESIGVLAGKFTYKKRIENNLKLKLRLEKVLPNGAKELMATHENDLCKSLENKQIDNLYSQYLRATNLPDKCPIEAGTYEIFNMVADTKHLSVNALMEGVYTITFTFYSFETVGSGLFATTKDTALGCLYFDCAVEPN